MDPIATIKQDRQFARQQEDSNSDICFLALADASGQPSVRTLVLREIDDNRFNIFINRTSPKWHLFEAGSRYQALLWYPSRQRQFRLSGTHEILDDAVVKPNWVRRPLGSKLLDVFYQHQGQSSPISSREALLEQIHTIKAAQDTDSMDAPDAVTGIALVVDQIEMLDLNQPDRIHDRRLFTLVGDSWQEQILVP